MAAEAPLQGFLEELTCSICLDFFQDPVLIPECGHNFCRGCLTCGWGTSESEASCPQCRQTFAPRSLLPIRQLAGGGGQTLICVVCDQSKEHRGHSVIPAEEAFPEYQIKVEDCLKAQKEEKEKIATYKGDTEQTVQEMLAKEIYENPVDLLLEPKWTIWDYRDMTELLKGAMKKLRDTLESGLQLQEENIILDPDTANPDRLEVSEDRKSVKSVKPVNQKYLFSDPMRFVRHPCVLGCQKFSTGRHFWEVIVGGKGRWGVGVASKPLNVTNVDKQTRCWMFGSKPVNLTDLDDQIRLWEFVKWRGKYQAISLSKCSKLVLTEEPRRIRISLNCEGGQVSFFDASTATLLYTFSDASLVGETLLPLFCLSEGTCMRFP
ncbi:E3 ubiquitin-protein ligase TRIM39-like [Pituophis catenifer annectens]|uniref:E3 ubiquitin-protein ligase TRIM39-like n=1 Tax=Pituophis catenifer annectens TaxID=94852 RepID=UPI00399523FB